MSCRQNSSAAKWNIFLSFGLKVPFGFPCLAHVCLSNSFGLVCFSTAYVTLVVALLFGSLVLLLLLYCYCYEYYYHSYNLTVTAVHMLQILWSWFAGRSGGNITSLKVKSCHWSFFGGQSPPPETWILAKGAGRHLLQCFAHFVVVRKRCPNVM